MGYDKIDFFGRATENPLELKSEGTNPYMFQIAIENAQRRFYFADKINDCFVTGTVPIYWGAPNIGDFFDKFIAISLAFSLISLDKTFRLINPNIRASSE